MRIIKQKIYGLMDAAGNAVEGTVNAARDVTGGAISGVGSVLDSGGGRMVGGLAGGTTALVNPLGLGATAAGATLGGATGATLGGLVGSVIPIAGNIAGAAIGGAIGTGLGAAGTGGAIFKAGQAVGSSLTGATGEGLKGIGNAIKSDREFSDIVEGPDAGDALNVGMSSAMGTGLKEGNKYLGFGGNITKVSAKSLEGLGKMAISGPGMMITGPADAIVNKGESILNDASAEANSYRPTVRNAFVKQSAFSDQNFKDAGNTIAEGVESAGKTLGNAAGGTVGGLTGMAAGAGAGALAGKGIVSASNKILGTKLGGGGKYGAIAGVIGGGILGAQKGSSLFSERVGSVMYSISLEPSELDAIGRGNFRSLKDSKIHNQSILEADLERASGSLMQRSFAVSGKLWDAAKGLGKVAGQHKLTIAEGLGMGAVGAGTGYLANRAIRQDREAEERGEKPGGLSAGKKIALGIGAGLAAGAALKTGAKLGAFKKLSADSAKYGTNANKAFDKAGTAIQMGTGFGAGLAAFPLAMQSMQESSMEDSQNGGMSTGKKLALGAAGLGAALVGGKIAAGKNWLGKDALKLSERIDSGIARAKNKIEGSILSEEALNNKRAYDAAKKTASEQEAKAKEILENAQKQAGGVDKMTKETTGSLLGDAQGLKVSADGQSITTASGDTIYANPTFMNSPGHRSLDFGTALLGGGTQKTQRLADQLKATDSEYLQKAGQFMKDHKKTALVAAAPLGYGAMMGTWDLGEKAVNAPLKKLDPETYKNQEEV